MNEAQRRFREIYPNVHPQVCEFFPDFDYRHPAPGAIIDMRDPNNCVGHQQRAFSVWHAIQNCGPLDLGLDFGSPKGMTPHCVHVDVFGDGRVHPFYGGGRYLADLAHSAVSTSFYPPDAWPYISSNHSLEHMDMPGDSGIASLLGKWIELLRGGGILAMVIPDNDHFDVLASDRNHYHAWGARDFRQRVLDTVLSQSPVQLLEYDTLDNHFSFNVVIQKV